MKFTPRILKNILVRDVDFDTDEYDNKKSSILFDSLISLIIGVIGIVSCFYVFFPPDAIQSGKVLFTNDQLLLFSVLFFVM